MQARPSGSRPSRTRRLGLYSLLSKACTVKAVFTDLDGTFLDEGHRVPAGAAEAVDRLQATGARFVPTTGRTLPALRRMLGPLLDRVDYVASNGLKVRARGRVLADGQLAREDAAAVLELVRSDVRQPLMAVFPTDGPAYLLGDDPAGMPSGVPEPLGAAELRPLEDGLADGDIEKVGVVARGRSFETAADYSRLLGSRLSFMACDEEWVDIAPLGTDKLHGAMLVMGELSAGKQEAVAFGDSMNDLDLMRGLPLSVAVGNAAPALKESCAYEIGPNSELSVLRCVEMMAGLREAAGLSA